jgi:hypothetical protein
VTSFAVTKESTLTIAKPSIVTISWCIVLLEFANSLKSNKSAASQSIALQDNQYCAIQRVINLIPLNLSRIRFREQIGQLRDLQRTFISLHLWLLLMRKRVEIVLT